jgi:choice-of-anchor B domain-containing protein
MAPSFKYRFVVSLLGGLLCFSGYGQEARGLRLLAQWFDDTPPATPRNSRYNDVWCFVQNGQEYAVIGSSVGTHIIHLPYNNAVQEVGFIPGTAQGAYATHRDFAYKDGYLYAVGDEEPATFQVIDVRNLPISVSLELKTTEYFTTAHNIFHDESSGLLYVSGSSGHAMTILDAANPAHPTFVTHFDLVEYVHDVYVRNSVAYLNAALHGLWVFDFSSPTNPVLLGNLTEYPQLGYNHSGWLNESGDVYVFADETPGKSLKVCDVSSISEIEVLSLLNSGGSSHTTPHNLIIKDNLVYVAYYFDGLQVFDIRNPQEPIRVAWYRTYSGQEYDYQGAWGVYVGLPSERIIVSDRQSGLLVFAHANGADVGTSAVQLTNNPGDGMAAVQVFQKNFRKVDVFVSDASGKVVFTGEFTNNADSFWIPIDLRDMANGYYFIGVSIDDGTLQRLKYLKLTP